MTECGIGIFVVLFIMITIVVVLVVAIFKVSDESEDISLVYVPEDELY